MTTLETLSKGKFVVLFCFVRKGPYEVHRNLYRTSRKYDTIKEADSSKCIKPDVGWQFVSIIPAELFPEQMNFCPSVKLAMEPIS